MQDPLPNLTFFKNLLSGKDLEGQKTPFSYPPPIAKTLGFDLVDIGEATATIEIETRTSEHANPMGTIHGGILCDIADAAIGTAHVTSTVLTLRGESASGR